MRPTVRRIDLTQTPTAVEVWPSLDWLEPTRRAEAPGRIASFGSVRSRSTMSGGPHGRSGLWDAMASAVQRARESSVAREPWAVPTAGDHDADLDAEIIEMSTDTPHLAYLARVAGNDGTGRDDLPGADVVALVDARMTDAG